MSYLYSRLWSPSAFLRQASGFQVLPLTKGSAAADAVQSHAAKAGANAGSTAAEGVPPSFFVRPQASRSLRFHQRCIKKPYCRSGRRMESFLLFHLLPFDDSSRISDDCTSIRHIFYDYRSRSDDDIIADIDSFFDDRIRPDKTPFPHCYITCKNGSRSNMRQISDHAFMLHDDRSVDNNSYPDIRMGI